MNQNQPSASLKAVVATFLRAYRYGGAAEVVGCVCDGLKSAIKPLLADIFGIKPPTRFWPTYTARQQAETSAASSGDGDAGKNAVARGFDSVVDRSHDEKWKKLTAFDPAVLETSASAAVDCCSFMTDNSVEKQRFSDGKRVSVVIPTKDRCDLLKVAVHSVRRHGGAMDVEIIIVDNGSVEKETAELLGLFAAEFGAVILRDDGPFNWSRLNNLAARRATGDLLLFLNNDVESMPSSQGWICHLAAYADIESVGCVGPMLLYPDGTIQHAGVVIGMGRWADHIYKGADPDLGWNDTPFIPPKYSRPVLAVTGACLMISSDKFEMLGGFDEAFQVVFSDVEFCVRSHTAGLVNIYAGDVRLYHHESKSRDPKAVPDADFREAREKLEPYRTRACDPFFHPRLDKFSHFPKSDLLPTNLSKWIRK